jgi:hypothetical protein
MLSLVHDGQPPKCPIRVHDLPTHTDTFLASFPKERLLRAGKTLLFLEAEERCVGHRTADASYCNATAVTV